MKKEVVLSKSGMACLWECGGGFSNTGYATCVADKYGNPKSAIFIKDRGDLACNEHALVPVVYGDLVCEVNRPNKFELDIKVYQVQEVENNSATLVELEDISKLQQLTDATVYKSQIYHCRIPVYVKQVISW